MSEGGRVERIAALDAQGDGLVVTFPRRRDRFAHVIACVVRGRFLPVLASVEGDDQELWPPSPPLQQLDVPPAASGEARVALLVGQAGRSHWSLTVEASPGGRLVVFDAACRLADPPGRLGSAYRTMKGPATFHSEQGARFDLGLPGGIRLAPAADGPPTAAHVTSGGVSLAPATVVQSPPATVRWRYVVERR